MATETKSTEAVMVRATADRVVEPPRQPRPLRRQMLRRQP